jgi:hypothetical protein
MPLIIVGLTFQCELCAEWTYVIEDGDQLLLGFIYVGSTFSSRSGMELVIIAESRLRSLKIGVANKKVSRDWRPRTNHVETSLT